jgi:hypothetical protein
MSRLRCRKNFDHGKLLMMRATIKVEISNEVAAALGELAAHCNHCGAIGDGFATHGAALTPEKLLAMLAEDASQIVTQPESWQSANTGRVLASHGYMVGRREP